MNIIDYLFVERDNFYKALFITLSLIVLIAISFNNFLLFHSIVEFFSIFIAFSIFAIIYYSGNRNLNIYLLILGAAFFFIGIFDFFHTLSYKGMNIFAQTDADLPTQLWIIARYIESLSLMAAFWFFKKDIELRFDKVFIIYFFISLFLSLSLYYQIFPTCYIEGYGLTLFKKVSEYIISIILIGVLFLLRNIRHKFNKKVFNLLNLSIILTIISELAFTFYIDVYGLSNIIGHVFKILSFLIIYEISVKTAIIQPQKILFNEFTKSEQKFEMVEKIANIGVWDWDYKTDKVIYDEKWAKMLGYRLIDLKFHISTWENLIHPEDKKKVKKELDEYLNGERALFKIKYRMKTRLGNYKWIRTICEIMERDKDDKIVRVMGINQDIDNLN